MDSKNYADLHLQMVASADCTYCIGRPPGYASVDIHIESRQFARCLHSTAIQG